MVQLQGDKMYCFVVSFDMIPENVVEGDKWLREIGVPFWASQDCVKRATLLGHGFSTYPKRTMMMEVTSLDALQIILGAPDRLEKRKEFEKYVTNESSYVLEYMADSNSAIDST
jgi:hypothetical protein